MYRHSKILNTLLVSSLLVGGIAYAAMSSIYKINPSSGNKISFTSDAPVEIIRGGTNQVNGHIRYDETFLFDAKHPFDIAFTVDLASLDTGIPLRNEHMRDNFLETKKYPEASFKATSIETTDKPPFKPGQEIHLTATGPFTLHGQSVTKSIPLTITYNPQGRPSGSPIRIQSKFPVSLQEHQIKRPEMVFQKLAETIYITVDLTSQKEQ